MIVVSKKVSQVSFDKGQVLYKSVMEVVATLKCHIFVMVATKEVSYESGKLKYVTVTNMQISYVIVVTRVLSHNNNTNWWCGQWEFIVS